LFSESGLWKDWLMDNCTGHNPAVAETGEQEAAESLTIEEKRVADQITKRLPPLDFEAAEIKKARRRTKQRHPTIAMHLADVGDHRRAFSYHSDDDGHGYRLLDSFGTRSFAFVSSMLEGLADATSDQSEDFGLKPGKSNELAFNSALAVIAGVQPKDEIEAVLAAHMAVANITLLELVTRTRQLIAGYEYQGNGIKRLEVIGNLASKFMRTYALQVEALAKKRRGGKQNVTVTHVYSGGQAVVGTVNHGGGRGVTKNGRQPHGRGKEKSTAGAISESPPVWGAEQEWRALSRTGDEKRAMSLPRRRSR
jgi:hypothetical protein